MQTLSHKQKLGFAVFYYLVKVKIVVDIHTIIFLKMIETLSFISSKNKESFANKKTSAAT